MRLLVVGVQSVLREERQVALLADVGHGSNLYGFDLTGVIEEELICNQLNQNSAVPGYVGMGFTLFSYMI